MLSRLKLAVASLVALLACAAPAAAGPTYVSLGDSYAAGPLIPLQIPPYGCLKSDHNYSHLAAPSLKFALRDPSCSGAKTDHMTKPQGVDPGPNPPQFDSLDSNTDLVTVQIGGNDIGFSEIVKNCAGTTSPVGHPCRDRYAPDGGPDQISERIKAAAPKVAAVLQGIRDRSPNAAVYVVNYLPIFPEVPLAPGLPEGCYPQIPAASGDVAYLRDKEKELNRMLADQAAAKSMSVLDTYSIGVGHDACQPPAIRWVEPAAPANSAAPFHPNLFGMDAEARLLAATVKKDGTASPGPLATVVAPGSVTVRALRRRGLRILVQVRRAGVIRASLRSHGVLLARGGARAKRAGRRWISLRLTAAGQRRAERLRGRQLKLHVTFDPAGAGKRASRFRLIRVR